MTNGRGIEAGALWMGVNHGANVFSEVEKASCRKTDSPSVKGRTLVHEFPPASVSALQIELV
jgi:hypothetical protein